VVELPGIEPDALPGNMLSELQFRYVSVQFGTARYLRFRFQVLTASRAVNAASWRFHTPGGRKLTASATILSQTRRCPATAC